MVRSIPTFPLNSKLYHTRRYRRRTDDKFMTSICVTDAPDAPRRRSPRDSAAPLLKAASNEPNAPARPYRPNTPPLPLSLTNPRLSPHSTTQRSRRALEDDPGVPYALTTFLPTHRVLLTTLSSCRRRHYSSESLFTDNEVRDDYFCCGGRKRERVVDGGRDGV